jgi:hypothetical protein
MPTSQTCFCIVDLPNYSTLFLLERKLYLALSCSTINS